MRNLLLSLSLGLLLVTGLSGCAAQHPPEVLIAATLEREAKKLAAVSKREAAVLQRQTHDRPSMERAVVQGLVTNRIDVLKLGLANGVDPNAPIASRSLAVGFVPKDFPRSVEALEAMIDAGATYDQPTLDNALFTALRDMNRLSPTADYYTTRVANYTELSNRLQEMGAKLDQSAQARLGQELETRLAATQRAALQAEAKAQAARSSSSSGNNFGQMMASVGMLAVTGAAIGSGVDPLVAAQIGGGGLLDILTEGRADGLNQATANLQQSRSSQPPTTGGTQAAGGGGRQAGPALQQEQSGVNPDIQRQQQALLDLQRQQQTQQPSRRDDSRRQQTAPPPRSAASSQASSMPREQPQRGCWAAPDPGKSSCVRSDGQWGRGMNSDRFIVTHENICSERIVVKMCNQRTSGTPLCGQGNIAPGQSRRWDSFSDSTGGYSVQWVGSRNSTEDWACVSQIGWRN